MVMQSAPTRLALAGLAAALALVAGPGRAAPAPAASNLATAAAAKPAKGDHSVPAGRAAPHGIGDSVQGSGLQHAVEQAVPNYPITLDIRDVPFDTALRTLLRLAPQVTYRKEGDIFIIGMRQPQVDTTASDPGCPATG